MREALILAAILVASAGMVAAQVPDEVRSLVQQGIAKHDQKDYDGAIELYRQALALSPNDPTAHFELAYSLYVAKRYDDALDQIMVALIKPGADKPLLYDLGGTILDTQGRFLEAEAEFRKSLQLEPTNPRVMFNLGACLLRQKKWSQSVAWIQRNLEKRPSHTESWRGLAIASDALGQRLEAILAFWRLAATAPESSEAVGLTDRAWTLLMKGVTRESKENIKIELGVSSGDDDPRAAENLMLSLTAAGRYVEEHEKQTDSEFLVGALESLADFGAGSTVAAPADSFWKRHLYAYFAALQEHKFTKAMVYSVRARLGEKGVAKWLEKNADKVEAWKKWQSSWKPIVVDLESTAPVEQDHEPEATPDGSADHERLP